VQTEEIIDRVEQGMAGDWCGLWGHDEILVL
jgi:hypothetical protein